LSRCGLVLAGTEALHGMIECCLFNRVCNLYRSRVPRALLLRLLFGHMAEMFDFTPEAGDLLLQCFNLVGLLDTDLSALIHQRVELFPQIENGASGLVVCESVG